MQSGGRFLHAHLQVLLSGVSVPLSSAHGQGDVRELGHLSSFS